MTAQRDDVNDLQINDGDILRNSQKLLDVWTLREVSS